jgi:hypothetical protein
LISLSSTLLLSRALFLLSLFFPSAIYFFFFSSFLFLTPLALFLSNSPFKFKFLHEME